jgi:hypothetical protein
MMNLYDYKQELDKEGILLSFSGPMTHEMIEGVGRAIRVKIEGGEEGDKRAALKVFSIFVEQVENVIRYSVEKDHVDSNMSFGIIVIGKKEGHFYIIGGNKIAAEKQEKLESYLQQLSKMNKDELKIFYKEKRRAERVDGSKGAGIGFIEMARKSSQPIEFNFQKVDEIHSFFTIKITI